MLTKKQPPPNMRTETRDSCTMLNDYHRIFATKPGASKSDIKVAYRRLVMQYHPDRNQDDPKADQRFQFIHHMYQHLLKQSQHMEYLGKQETNRLSAEEQGLLKEFLGDERIAQATPANNVFRYHANTIKRHYQTPAHDKGVKVAIAI